MTQPVFKDSHTMSAYEAFPHPTFITRNRREANPVDCINARQFENWQVGHKSGTYNRPDVNNQAPFFDSLPNNTRLSDRNYRSQPRYDVDERKGVENPFFDRYDTTSDSRNMARELKASVYEDKKTGFINESEKLLERNFDNRWLQPNPQMINELRPKMDDIRVFYNSS